MLGRNVASLGFPSGRRLLRIDQYRYSASIFVRFIVIFAITFISLNLGFVQLFIVWARSKRTGLSICFSSPVLRFPFSIMKRKSFSRRKKKRIWCCSVYTYIYMYIYKNVVQKHKSIIHASLISRNNAEWNELLLGLLLRSHRSQPGSSKLEKILKWISNFWTWIGWMGLISAICAVTWLPELDCPT